MTPEQFYSESKWPEMKDKFDKTALLFNHYDLCQFAYDYAQQELQAYRDIIKELIPLANEVTAVLINGQLLSRSHEQTMLVIYEYKSTIERAKTLIDTVTTT